MSALTGLSGQSLFCGQQLRSPDWVFLVRADQGISTISNNQVTQVVEQSPWNISTGAQGGRVVEVANSGTSPRGITPLFFGSDDSRLEYGSQYVFSSNRDNLLDQGFAIVAVLKPKDPGPRRFVLDQGFFGKHGIGLICSTDQIGGYTPLPQGNNGSPDKIETSWQTSGGWQVISLEVDLNGGSMAVAADGVVLGNKTPITQAAISDPNIDQDAKRGNILGPLCIGLQSKTGLDDGRGYTGGMLACGICPVQQVDQARQWVRSVFL